MPIIIKRNGLSRVAAAITKADADAMVGRGEATQYNSAIYEQVYSTRQMTAAKPAAINPQPDPADQQPPDPAPAPMSNIDKKTTKRGH